MFFYIFIIAISILMSVYTLKSNNVRNQSSKYKLVLLIVISAIILFRIIRYGSAMGLNVDEAMGGYNSWCLANYGVDSHLMKAPVYLIAWGSGMNVLYPAISIPFVKLFGLNLLSYRFPMVFFSILSMFTLYNALMKNIHRPKLNLLFIVILFLNPWMIMANRWSLESNLFPIVMIFALSAFLMFVGQKSFKKSTIWFVIFNICVGLSAYAYSNNWIFLAVLVPVLFILLYKKKKINLKEFLVGVVTLLIIIWPLILFVYVNYIGHHTLHILGLTIPELWASRSSSQLIFGNGTPIVQAMLQNFLGNINMIANGDGMVWNSLPVIGLMFPGMFIVAMIGLVISINKLKKNSLFNLFMIVSVISSIPLLLFVIPDANHMNALILPIFYFETLGLERILNTKFLQKSALVIFVMMMMWFSYGYFGQNAQALSNSGTITSLKLKKLFDKANKSGKEIYFIDDQNGGMFSIARFWEPISPYVFNRVKSNDPKQAEMNYQYYGKWHFYQNTDSSMQNLKHSFFIVLANDQSIDLNNLPSNAHKLGDFGAYVVYEN
ncbi:ArnT family glycosyltransferase [Ligilactobacillus aviarius]|uniref:ArnT family glycosyltransferase n=1 Tax=Ligilactobacillus aviarius TaxID=1606 RepID=UPI0024B9E5D1|nr:glycosyl transferase [Ligilactobacillus aviarius]